MRVGEAVVMAPDRNSTEPPSCKGLSLDAKDGAYAEKLFNALNQGGKMQMPLGKTLYASSEIQGAMQCNCSICPRNCTLMWFVPRQQLPL